MNSNIKIAIVDDNRLTINSLKEMLQYIGEFDVEITASNGVDFLNKIEELRTNMHPDLVLMDIDMPQLNGIQTISIAKNKYPNMKFLVLTVFDDEDKLFQAIQAGAHGYLLKDEKIAVIAEHIKSLINNESTPMSPSIARKTFEMLSKLAPTEKKNEEIYNLLSGREVDVLKLMMEGYNYKIIAEKLFISPNTVKKHIAHIYEKLHVTSKTQLLKLGLNV